MAASEELSPEYLAETNDPLLAHRVCIAFIVLNTLFLALFVASHHFNPKAVGKPMLVCNVLSYVFCLGSATAGILMAKIGGAGYHVEAVPVTTFQAWLQLSKVLEFTYTLAVMFSKLAALCLYYKVFEVPVYRRIVIGISVIIVLQGVISFILAFTICRPFRYFWTQAVDPDDGSCGDVMMFYKTYSIPSLLTDLAMLVLPWPILLRLQMPAPEKIGLILTFLAGSLGIITCAIRLGVFFTVPLFDDPTWYASGGPTIYALVEPSIYMIASILPTTRHLYRRLHRNMRQTAKWRSAHGGYHEQNGSPYSQPAELDRMDTDDTRNRKGTRQVEVWEGHIGSSQEELTLR